nr:hypothetical protein [Tanacetum cinerariifolium]
MIESDSDSPLQPPQARTQGQLSQGYCCSQEYCYLGEDLDTFIEDVISLRMSLRMSFHQPHQKLLQLLPNGGKRKYTPHYEGLNKLFDNCVHNISQYTPTHKFGHGLASNEMTDIVSKPLIVSEIAETNGTCSDAKTSIPTHSQHPHCWASKRI